MLKRLKTRNDDVTLNEFYRYHALMCFYKIDIMNDVTQHPLFPEFVDALGYPFINSKRYETLEHIRYTFFSVVDWNELKIEMMLKTQDVENIKSHYSIYMFWKIRLLTNNVVRMDYSALFEAFGRAKARKAVVGQGGEIAGVSQKFLDSYSAVVALDGTSAEVTADGDKAEMLTFIAKRKGVALANPAKVQHPNKKIFGKMYDITRQQNQNH